MKKWTAMIKKNIFIIVSASSTAENINKHKSFYEKRQRKEQRKI